MPPTKLMPDQTTSWYLLMDCDSEKVSFHLHQFQWCSKPSILPCHHIQILHQLVLLLIGHRSNSYPKDQSLYKGQTFWLRDWTNPPRNWLRSIPPPFTPAGGVLPSWVIQTPSFLRISLVTATTVSTFASRNGERWTDVADAIKPFGGWKP